MTVLVLVIVVVVAGAYCVREGTGEGRAPFWKFF